MSDLKPQSRQLALYRRRKAAGLCTQCGAKTSPKKSGKLKSRCESCLNKIKPYDRAVRMMKRKQAGGVARPRKRKPVTPMDDPDFA